MKSAPRTGTAEEIEFLVEEKHAIDFATDGMPAVLSTPHLIGLLERTARKAIEPMLEPNERTVGMEIELRHLAPVPVGRKVRCVARVVHAEGKQITFQVEARDEVEIIARGMHKRAVIRVESFSRKVSEKLK